MDQPEEIRRGIKTFLFAEVSALQLLLTTKLEELSVQRGKNLSIYFLCLTYIYVSGAEVGSVYSFV